MLSASFRCSFRIISLVILFFYSQTGSMSVKGAPLQTSSAAAQTQTIIDDFDGIDPLAAWQIIHDANTQVNTSIGPGYQDLALNIETTTNWDFSYLQINRHLSEPIAAQSIKFLLRSSSHAAITLDIFSNDNGYYPCTLRIT